MASGAQKFVTGLKTSVLNLFNLKGGGRILNLQRDSIREVQHFALFGIFKREARFGNIWKYFGNGRRYVEQIRSYHQNQPAFRRFIPRTPVTFTYLLLPFPLKVLLTQASCEHVECDECIILKPAVDNLNSTSPCPVPTPEPPRPAGPSSCKVPVEQTAPMKTKPCSKPKDGCSVMQWCEPQQLSHKVLVRQACQITVDSVTRVIGETVSAYQDYHNEYRSLMGVMMDALDDVRSAHGTSLEVLDCKLILIRSRVEEMKRSIVEVECFMSSIQKLAEAASEAAYLGNAEYHSVCMCERLRSAVNEMASIREESLRIERDLIELQSVVIVESGKCLK